MKTLETCPDCGEEECGAECARFNPPTTWAEDEQARKYAQHRETFAAKRKRDYDLVRAKYQFGKDQPPPPPDPEPDKPTKMPVAI